MQLAIDRIASAMKMAKKILVYGDYDVDGTTAVSLMYLYLSKIVRKKIFDFYIQIVIRRVWNLMKELILLKKTDSLIIALDCGIKH